MIWQRNLRKGLVFSTPFAVAAMLAGCITSQDVLLNAAATPARPGPYQVQYLTDGKWTTFAAGSLALANRKYTWTENRGAFSLLSSRPGGGSFSLADIGNNYFIVVASADVRNPTWTGNYIYGIAQRTGDAFQYDFPSCLDLLVSQGLSDAQIGKIESHECLYSSTASLTNALIGYAKRTAMWKRLAPSGR